MTNAELIAIAKKEAEEIFAKRAKMTGREFKIDIVKGAHNSAHISVKAIYPSFDRHIVTVVENGVERREVRENHWNEYAEVGCGCHIYAITGQENVIKRIHYMYDFFAGVKKA